MRHQLTTLLLGPLLYWQGRDTRRNTPLLPEPPGPRAGFAGRGEPLRVLIVGDSAAAGVGAPDEVDALSGSLVAALAPFHAVDWELHAKTGATTASTLQYLEHMAPKSFDLAITSLGVNDVTTGVGQRAWLAQQSELRRCLRDKFAVRLMLISGLPPVAEFPALPQPLRWYLGSRADDFDRDLERVLAAESDSRFLSLRFSGNVSAMAADGFHPGPAIYSEWGARAADIALAGL